MGHRVAVLWKGRIVQTAAPEDLYRLPADADLARFIGEAVLLPGRAQNGSVTCALGRLSVEGPRTEGPVEVLLRPEQIRLASADSGGAGVRARVREVVYYGHDASVRLQLIGGDSSEELTARVAGYQSPHVGDEVAIIVEGRVVTYRGGRPE